MLGKRRSWSLAIVVSLILSVHSTQQNFAFASEQKILIGFQGPLTGEEGIIGQDQLTAVNYAVKLFNQAFKGSYRVEVIKIDDQGDPSLAGKVAPDIALREEIIGIVGSSYSGTSIASIPFYKARNLAMISPSATRLSLTDPQLGRLGFPIFHRVVSTDRAQGPFLYRLATRGVANPRVFIIDDQSAYGTQLRQFIVSESSPQNIVGTESASDKTSDWTSSISKIRSAGANVVIYTGYFPQAALLFRQLRDSGFTGILAGGDGVLSPSLLTLAPASVLSGVRLTSGTVPLGEINNEIEENFKREMGRASGVYAAEAIDATNVFLYCIAKGETTRLQILTCIDSFRGKSIYGHQFSFDVNGDNQTLTFYSFEISSGAFKYVDPNNRQNIDPDTIIEEFPWYSVTLAGSKSVGGQQSETMELQRDCSNYNQDLERLLESIRNAAIEYPTSVKVFIGLLGIAPKALSCETIALSKLNVELTTKRTALGELQQTFNEAEIEAFEIRKTIRTISCIKGKRTKKVTAVNPKCPKGYKKK